MNLDADNEVQLLPPLLVCRAVGDVGLRGGEAAGVLVAGAVHAPAGMERRCHLA